MQSWWKLQAQAAALRAQGCILTCALDGTVKVWQFVPDATREKGALVDTTPVYIHPPEDEGASGRNTQACACGLRSAQRLSHKEFTGFP